MSALTQGLYTIVRKEWARIIRIWPQTLLPPVITSVLYFVIFGAVIGARIGEVDGVRYMDFVVPGLVLMAVIQNSYGNVSSSFFGSKFGRYVEELLVSPLPDWLILLGYVLGGVLRGMAVGALVLLVAAFFTVIDPHDLLLMLLVGLLVSLLFSLAGMINAIYARKFDDIAIIPTFVLTPLTYFGGVFYPVGLLPEPWKVLSELNPILYFVSAFRYGLVGHADVSLIGSLLLAISGIVVLTALNLRLMARGTGLRS